MWKTTAKYKYTGVYELKNNNVEALFQIESGKLQNSPIQVLIQGFLRDAEWKFVINLWHWYQRISI